MGGSRQSPHAVLMCVGVLNSSDTDWEASAACDLASISRNSLLAVSNFLCAVPRSPWHVNPVPQFLLPSCLERGGLLGEAFRGSLSRWVSAGKVRWA